MKNHYFASASKKALHVIGRLKNHYLLTVFSFATLFIAPLSSCSPINLADEEEEETDGGGSGGSAKHAQNAEEVLIAITDTARFYLSGIEISNVMLQDYPTPETLIQDTRYRLPRRLEVYQVLRLYTLPAGYWLSGQRILCYDDPNDAGAKIGTTTFGTGDYYTFLLGTTMTKAGYKTNYCIIPIRSERINRWSIDVDDKWDVPDNTPSL